MTLRVKNWADFQHYKERNPPWIKLHKSLLDDFKFHRLPVASRALAPMIWLLASENRDGTIDAGSEELAFRLRMTEQEFDSALKPLIDNGFVVIASETLASCKRDAMPETETETELETEKSAIDFGEIVLKVLQAYPQCKYRHEMEIPPIVSNAVQKAINLEKGQWWLVEGYAKAYADSKPAPQFVMAPEKFFSDPNKYRKEWANGDKQTGRYTELLNSMETPDGEPGEFTGTVGSSKGAAV